MISKFIFNAVKTLDPEGTTSISVTDDDTDKILFLSNPKNITVEQIIDKIPEVEAEDASQEYARNRQAEYPSINELIVALWENVVEERASAVVSLEAKRQAVKTKYPKG